MATFSPRLRPTFALLPLLIFSLFLFLYNLRHPSNFTSLDKEVFSFATQCQKFVNKLFLFPINVWERYIYLIDVEEKNEILTTENNRLRQENATLRESDFSTRRLRDLLHFKQSSPLNLVAAEVIGVDASVYFKSIFIDKGKKDGVKKNMAVIIPQGVVGRILKATDYSSMVMLLIDQNFAFDAVIQRTRSRGVVEGMGSSLCRMKYIPPSDDVRSRDLVVTSGLEGIFPKGTIVGEIISVKNTPSPFKDVVLRPIVDFGKLEEVFVVLGR